jgi:hypothetical protein
MEPDPWGSAVVDPWTTATHAQDEEDAMKRDPLNVPKDFILECRPSTSTDPWGNMQAVSSSDDGNLGGNTTASGSAALPLPSASWAANTEDDGGWGTPAPMVEKNEAKDSSSFDQDRAVFEPPKSFALSIDNESKSAEDEVQHKAVPVAEPALSPVDHDSDSFRSPSPPTEAPTHDLESDYPSFKPFPADD